MALTLNFFPDSVLQKKAVNAEVSKLPYSNECYFEIKYFKAQKALQESYVYKPDLAMVIECTKTLVQDAADLYYSVV